MKRRDFLKEGVRGLAAFSAAGLFPGVRLVSEPAAQQAADAAPNTNWADPALGAIAHASNDCADPPWGYAPEDVFGEDLQRGWQTDSQVAGAWIEIGFPEPRQVSELWLLAEPLPADILGQEVYQETYPRTSLLAAPRRIQISFSSGSAYTFQLLQANYFQIFGVPRGELTSFVRITVEDVWPKPGATETGVGKIRVFPHRHSPAFEIAGHAMYDVEDGKAVQTATVRTINPGEAIPAANLQISSAGTTLMTLPLQAAPARSVCDQGVWIPAPFEDTVMEFEVIPSSAQSFAKQSLRVPKYHSYFDGGTFEFLCTNHNDLGWLNTPEKTADYRSSALIMPALEQLREYPEFLYSMESTAYLMEFLDRHPEKRGEMAERMRQRRFTWGASYVQLLQLSAGPEKLVRQFYFGRRWLKTTFPGVDTHFYIQSDPPNMSLQMPQILAKAGIKYCLLGRLPFGFYNWQSPDGSSVLTRGFLYVDASTLLDPKGNSGWLPCAEERASYYASHQLPRKFVYDYTSDYLPPQPDLVPHARRENKRMESYATVWNKHFSDDKTRHISPPRLKFTTPEAFLDEFASAPLNLTTLYGDWPCAWAYYDEPSNREALLNGRLAHNSLLAGERLCAGLGLSDGFGDYPARDFEEAWRANTWPDHGWGGNRGILTDKEYADSYAKSRRIAEAILSRASSQLASRLPRARAAEIPVAVFNPLSWTRTDVVEFAIEIPDHWPGWILADEEGREVPCELVAEGAGAGAVKIAFLAEQVPAVGYRCFSLQPASVTPRLAIPLTGETMENAFFRVEFGRGGIKRLYDKQRNWEVLRTEKFDGAEVLDFSAPGRAWEDVEAVGMQDFDRTANHDFPFTSFTESPLRVRAVREARFRDFALKECFSLYSKIDRLDIDIEIADWSGEKARELRVAFPINLDAARLSYEVPFGTVEIGKDELDFSQLPSNTDSQFSPKLYGGDHPLAFREAINWIDASSPDYLKAGCLAASDMTVHIFQDETSNPVSYPVLQHVLLSTRKSLAWNPEYWFTQKGSHRYRSALFPHDGNWRLRYREAIGFNYPLIAFAGRETTAAQRPPLPSRLSFLSLEPSNLIQTAMKKSEDDNRIVIRFYEAEGNTCVARIRLPVPIRKAWKTSLIEDDETMLPTLDDGSLEFPVKAWEIVTLKAAVGED